MSTQSNAIPDSPLESQAAPAAISAKQRLYFSIRRELWENRSLYIAPLIVAGVIVFAFLISSVAGIWERPLRLDPTLPPAKLAFPYTFAELLLMGTTFVVAIFYCLDALHGERRDRSILFWKSLPVSDFMTVLSKGAIPIVVLPLLTFAITLATQWIILLVSTAVVAASGGSVTMLWSHLPFLRIPVMMLYHLVAIHGLWYAPIFAWLLLVSAWARRAPVLWAALPLLAIGIIEKLTFNTTRLAALLGDRVAGGSNDAPFTAESMSMPLAHFNLGHFLISPGLWIGLAIAAAFMAAAVRLRRYQGPI